MGLLSQLGGRRNNDRIPSGMFDPRAGAHRERSGDPRSPQCQHGRPQFRDRERRALSRICPIIVWGELAAWRNSAQVPVHTRTAHALGVVARTRAGVLEIAERSWADAWPTVTARAGSPITATDGAEAE